MREIVPIVTDVMEVYTKTPEGLSLWKTKGIELSLKNVLKEVFILSTDLANYFDMYHFNLVKQNIHKLQREGYLDHVIKFNGMIEVGKSAQREQMVYALTRQQTELLIMDFSGPKSRQKKFAIVKRFHAMENDLTHGLYQEALQKVQTWDGVNLLKEFGFTCSLDGDIATKKDIVSFLKVPAGTLNSFLRKHSDQITAINLGQDQIKAIGSRARRMYGYQTEEVFKIVCGMDTEIGIKFKKRMFGQIGAFAKPQVKDEIQWRKLLSEVFKRLGLHYNYLIGKYRVDFFVETMMLCLECNGVSHKYYNPQEEEKREKFITEKYALVRFQPDTSLESLFNAILHAKTGKVIRLESQGNRQKSSLNPDNN